MGAAVARGERDANVPDADANLVMPLVDRLLAARRPGELPSQVIHSDIGGNVPFADGLPPAVIDFSTMYRPAGFALAIAAFDAITWINADPSIFRLLGDVDELDQLLLRAAILRLVVAGELYHGQHGRLAHGMASFDRTVELILGRLNSPQARTSS